MFEGQTRGGGDGGMSESERTGEAKRTGRIEAKGTEAVFGPAGRTAEIARPRHKHLPPQAP